MTNNDFSFTNYFTYKDEVSRTIIWGHKFLFLNIFLTLLIGTTYLYSAQTPGTFLGFLYLFLGWLGHFSSIVFIIYLIIFFPLSFIGSLRVYRVLAVILSVIALTILAIDIKLYQAIKIHLSISVFSLFFEQEGFSTGLNFNFLYITIPILIGTEIFISNLAWKHIYTSKSKKIKYLSTSIFLIAFILTHLLNSWADAFKYTPITISKTLFPAYYPMTANTFLREHGWIKDIQTKDGKLSINSKIYKLKYPFNDLVYTPHDKPQNVIFLFINGLNYNDLNAENTPNLYKFANENYNFKEHYIGSLDPSSNAFEIFYGLPGQYFDDIINEQQSPIILSEMLKQDYRIHSFSTGKFNDSTNKLFTSSGLRKKQISLNNSDKETIDKAIQWISNWNDRPQFTIISISPFESIIENNKSSHSFKKLEGMRLYNLKSADRQLKDLLTILNEQKDNSLIIITSLSTFNINHDYQKYTYTRNNHHTPLIIATNSMLFKDTSILTSNQDISPNISKDILGIKNNFDDYSTGFSMTDNLNSRPWILSGDAKEIHIITTNQTTIFDKNGNASIYTSDPNKTPTQPTIVMLIKAMKLLNKFKEK